MSILLAITILLPQAVEIQTDWVSGPGTLGPVNTWGSVYYQSDSINYNISGQISLVSTTTPAGWDKHIIQTNTQIRGQDGVYPADFDGDGDLDLAAWWGGTSSDNKVRIYKNLKVETGTADFTIQTDLILPNGTTYYGLLWCGDFDNDSDADIVVPCSPGPWWFENNGSFNFTPYTIGSIVYNRASCDVGDVDNDGDKDIVIIGVLGNSGTPGSLDLWRNDGAMNFTWQNITSNGNWWRVMLGDLNNDNYLDIFNSGYVFLNSSGNYPGTPSWTVPYAEDVDGIWIRDFNNDGKKDLLIGFQWASIPEMAWFENDGSGISYTKHTICVGDTAFQHADACIGEDIDLDGKTDVVGTYQRVGYFRQITPTSFELTEIDTINDSHWAFVANLDYMPGGTDIDLDILVSSVDTFAWYENIAAGVQYALYGYLESSILEKNEALSWQKIHWIGSCPNGTYLALWVRSGVTMDSIQSNAWQGPFVIPTGQPNGEFDISGVTISGHHYFQYKVEMDCGTANETPVLYEARVEYIEHDVGVNEIIAPTGMIPAGSTVTPIAIVENFGAVTETFAVVFEFSSIVFDQKAASPPILNSENITRVNTAHPRFDAVYTDTLIITLSGGEVDTIEFTPWTAVIGTYEEMSYSLLDSDENHANDTAYGRFEVVAAAIHDVGVLEILEPIDTIIAGTTVTPTAVFKNFGGYDEDFYGFFTIGCLYYDFCFIHLDAGQTATVTFRPWVAVAGYYNEAASTYLEEDENPDNNAVDEWLMVTEPYEGVAGNKIPVSFELFKPYPNPTANRISIGYGLPNASKVELSIYNINGVIVKELVSETRTPGYYRVDTDLQELGNGVYIVKMKADKFEARTKFIKTN